LAPELTVIAPWREWDLDSRTSLMEFARKHDIPVPVTTERPYSTDRNLFHISFEGGILEDPWVEPPPKMFLLTNSPESAPDVPVYIEIGYEGGDPVSVDGWALGPVAGRRSPRSLYRTDFVTFEADRVYRQKDAEGFINLNALRLKIRALRDRSR